MHGDTKTHPDSGLDFPRLNLDAATDPNNYFPPPFSCQWHLFYSSVGQMYHIDVYRAFGACQAEFKEMYYQNGILVNTVYK